MYFTQASFRYKLSITSVYPKPFYTLQLVWSILLY